MGVSIIAAVARNGVIGADNALPWHLPEDLGRFRVLTMGHHIVMGRRTFESLGRLLPGRTTVVVSRDPHYVVAGGLAATSFEAALAACGNDPEIFVIGGAELYRTALACADRMYVTEIDAAPAGDTHFPSYDRTCWREIAREPGVAANGWSYAHVTYQRVDCATQST